VTPNQKVNKVRKFGGSYIDIRLEGDTFDDAAKAAQEYCKANGMVFVHPFDDELVIAGQGTIAKEIHEQLEGKLDYVMVAIGGGGMIAGIASALKGIGSDAEVVGVETETQTAMYQSLQKGERISIDKLDTFVDGTAVKTPGEITFSIIKDTIKDIVLVREGQVAVDMIELYQNEGIVAEPAGALAISGLENVAEKIKGKTVVCIICGGNNDLLRYPEILERSLVYRGLKHYFLVEFAQKPGQLKMFLNDVLGPNDDIVLFEYIKKNNKEKGPALVGIELSDKKDIDPLLERLNIAGFKYTKLTQDSMLYQYLV
jgi:threonine dehydratase